MAHRYFQTVAGADDTSAGVATKLKWEFDEDLGRYYVSFSSWDDRGSSIWVIFFSFGFVRSRTMCVLWMMYELYDHCVKWRL